MDSIIFNALKGLFSNRVYPVKLNENTVYPALVYAYVGNAEEPFVNAGQLIERWRVQFTIYGKDYDQVSVLRNQVMSTLRELNEFIEQAFDVNGYESDTKLFTWVLDMSFRTPQ